MRAIKLAFHGGDTDTDILATILGMSGDFPIQLSTRITSGNRSRMSDMSARILARKSVSVSASWNASFSIHARLTFSVLIPFALIRFKHCELMI